MNIKLISAQLCRYNVERVMAPELYRSFSLYLHELIRDTRRQLIGKKVKVISTGKIYSIIGVGVGGTNITFNCISDEFYITVNPDEIEFV